MQDFYPHFIEEKTRVWEETYPSHWVEWALCDHEVLLQFVTTHQVWQAAALLLKALYSCWFELYGIAIFIGPKGQIWGVSFGSVSIFCPLPGNVDPIHRSHPSFRPISVPLSSRWPSCTRQIRCICLLRADRTENHWLRGLDNRTGLLSGLEAGTLRSRTFPIPVRDGHLLPGSLYGLFSILSCLCPNLLSL